MFSGHFAAHTHGQKKCRADTLTVPPSPGKIDVTNTERSHESRSISSGPPGQFPLPWVQRRTKGSMVLISLSLSRSFLQLRKRTLLLALSLKSLAGVQTFLILFHYHYHLCAALLIDLHLFLTQLQWPVHLLALLGPAMVPEDVHGLVAPHSLPPKLYMALLKAQMPYPPSSIGRKRCERPQMLRGYGVTESSWPDDL